MKYLETGHDLIAYLTAQLSTKFVGHYFDLAPGKDNIKINLASVPPHADPLDINNAPQRLSLIIQSLPMDRLATKSITAEKIVGTLPFDTISGDLGEVATQLIGQLSKFNLDEYCEANTDKVFLEDGTEDKEVVETCTGETQFDLQYLTSKQIDMLIPAIEEKFGIKSKVLSYTTGTVEIGTNDKEMLSRMVTFIGEHQIAGIEESAPKGESVIEPNNKMYPYQDTKAEAPALKPKMQNTQRYPHAKRKLSPSEIKKLDELFHKQNRMERSDPDWEDTQSQIDKLLGQGY